MIGRCSDWCLVLWWWWWWNNTKNSEFCLQCVFMISPWLLNSTFFHV